MSEPTILLIGATGPLGRSVLTVAVQRGLSLRAFACNPEKFAEDLPSIHSVAQSDVLDRPSLICAMQHISTVISVLGTPLTLSPVTLLSEGTRNMIAAMDETGVARLLCVTGTQNNKSHLIAITVRDARQHRLPLTKEGRSNEEGTEVPLVLQPFPRVDLVGGQLMRTY